MAELVAAQRAGSVVRQIVEAAGSPGNDVELQRATLYDCAVVIFNLAGAASECTVLQRDLVGEIGEGGMLPALATIARVRWVDSETNDGSCPATSIGVKCCARGRTVSMEETLRRNLDDVAWKNNEEEVSAL